MGQSGYAYGTDNPLIKDEQGEAFHAMTGDRDVVAPHVQEVRQVP
jgi:hypothetical protein